MQQPSAGGAGAAPAVSAARRLQADLKKLMAEPVTGVSAFPGDDMNNWVGTIAGPEGTPYEGHVYKLALRFPSDYPYNPPTVDFAAGSMYHPNVHFAQGAICLDILKNSWSPLLDVRTVLLSIQSLLNEPNNNSPLNPAAAATWANPDAFRAQVINVAGGKKEGGGGKA